MTVQKTVKKFGAHFSTGNTGNTGNMKLKQRFLLATGAATTGNKYFTNNGTGNKVATKNVAKKVGLATKWQQYVLFKFDSKIKSFIFKKDALLPLLPVCCHLPPRRFAK